MTDAALDLNQKITCKIPHTNFLNAIKACLHFAGKKDVRYYLNGVLIEFETNLINVVATDGHVLLRVPVYAHGLPIELKDKQYILERKSAELLLKAISPKTSLSEAQLTLVTPGKDEHFVSINSEDGLMQVVGLIDGKFPDYRRVIPKDYKDPSKYSGPIGLNTDYLAKLSKLKDLNGPINGTNMYCRAPGECVVFENNIKDSSQIYTAVIMPMRI